MGNFEKFSTFLSHISDSVAVSIIKRASKTDDQSCRERFYPRRHKKHWSHIATAPVNAYRAEIIRIFLLRTSVNGYGLPLPRNLFCVVRRLFLSFFCDVRDNVGCVLRTISISANSHVIDSSQPVAPHESCQWCMECTLPG